MRIAEVYVQDKLAGLFKEIDPQNYSFEYVSNYSGPPISLVLPIEQKIYDFREFPPFFDGLLPEGPQLEALLRQEKIDRNDYFLQLVTVGNDLVGDVTVKLVL